MPKPDYPIKAPPVDDPLALVEFILRLYDDPALLRKYGEADYEARLVMLTRDAPEIKDPMHRHALAKGDAPRLHVALTHNLGRHVHTLDCLLSVTMEHVVKSVDPKRASSCGRR